MKYKTTKLKRYRIICTILNILMLPVRLPIFILYKLGEFSDKALDCIDNIAHRFLRLIVKTFKFDEIAQKQYEINKEKFKEGVK